MQIPGALPNFLKPSAAFLAVVILCGSAISQDEPPTLPPPDPKLPAWLLDSLRKTPSHPISKYAPVFQVGGDVTAPRAIYAPGPKYSKEARQAQYFGTAVLWLIVGADGLPHDIKLARSLGHGLDEEAIDAVKKWKFAPATKDGKPVAVMVNVEIHFRLH